MLTETIFEEILKIVTTSSEAHIRIGIAGLAYCKLYPEIAEIFFLRHVKNHHLTLLIYKKSRTTGAIINTDQLEIKPGENIRVTPFDAVMPESIVAHARADFKESPLSDILNMIRLHGTGISPIDSPPVNDYPSFLNITNCAFYTMSKAPGIFQFIEQINGTPTLTYPIEKEIGYIMGGKINYNGNGGHTKITINDIEKFDLPHRGETDEYAYDVFFVNHCGPETLCPESTQTDTDFSFYYNVLADDDNPHREFKMQKKLGLEVAPGPGKEAVGAEACNVTIIEPVT